MTASGTFGSGAEYSEFTDLNRLGAVVTKGVANVPWLGNPTPRVAEVYGGMLNAVGLQNPGIDLFCERDIPFLKKYDTKIIVNVCGHSTEEYVEVVKRLAEEPVDMLEINISCPNVKEGGIAFGQDPKAVEAITKEMKKYAKQPVIMKLSPNVTDITEMARAAEAGGADRYSCRTCQYHFNRICGIHNPTHTNNRNLYRLCRLVNHTHRYRMNCRTGHPTGLICKDKFSAVDVNLHSRDGINQRQGIGTANFRNPAVTMEIVEGIERYMEKYHVSDIKELIGAVSE